MDIDLDPELEAFRSEVAAFLAVIALALTKV